MAIFLGSLSRAHKNKGAVDVSVTKELEWQEVGDRGVQYLTYNSGPYIVVIQLKDEKSAFLLSFDVNHEELTAMIQKLQEAADRIKIRRPQDIHVEE